MAQHIQTEGPLPGLSFTYPAAASDLQEHSCPHPPHWGTGAWWKDMNDCLHDRDPHLGALTQHPTPPPTRSTLPLPLTPPLTLPLTLPSTLPLTVAP